MHPRDLLQNCHLRTQVDSNGIEVFDSELLETLKNIHPLNFLKTKLEFPTYKITVGYKTEKGNYRTAEKYAVFNSPLDDEYSDMWVNMFIQDYNKDHPQHKMVDCKILSMQKLGDIVLPIG